MTQAQRLMPVVGLVILALLVFVALNPNLTYAPVPRVILFLLAAVFPALFITTTAATKFRLEAKNFLFMTTGASAFFLFLLFALTYLAKPQLQVVMFEVVDKDNTQVNLAPMGAFQLEAHQSGISANAFIKGNAVVMVFPEQIVEQRIRVKLATDGPVYSAPISYAKPPTKPLRIGTDLVN
jgi:hypothetical protein